MAKKIGKSQKKNSLVKNIGITVKAWFKRYPSAIFLVPFYIAVCLLNPFLNTLLSSKAVGAITAGDAVYFIKIIALLLLAITLCNGASQIVSSFLWMQRVYTRLGVFAGNLFKKCVYTDYKNIELQKNQKLLGKASNSIGSNWNGPEAVMNEAVNITITFLGIFTYGAVIFQIDWKILLSVLAMFIGNVSLQTAAIKYNDKHREEGSEIWRKKKYVFTKSTNISAGKDIRIFQLQHWFNELLDDVIVRRRKFNSRIELRWYFPTISDVIFNFIRDWLAYSILIKRVLCGQMNAATFTLYIGLIGTFSSWIYSLAGNYNHIKRASHEFNDYFDYMNLPERETAEHKEIDVSVETTSPANSTSSLQNAPCIEFRNVSFAYDGAEKDTLSNLNFTIHAGEKIALVGNNGAGKTTIVKLLTGLYKQTGGDILVNGKSIDEIGLGKYQDTVSVLFQDTTPMSFSIEENITGIEAGKSDKAKVWNAIKEAGLEEKINSLKNKENTYITQDLNEEGILLSGGETQKLLLAKAIYKNGSFLILDEPTSALDPLAESKIYEEYNQMTGGKTAVFISHRLASTKFCDKIMFLDGGQIAEYGTHDELMKKGGKYKEMFDIQSQYYVDGKDAPADKESAVNGKE